ncbi:hypothetical protein C8046_13955 [Serinibacter arcticus]|uniref:Uncharacterized protein n=1 Tax=Serinibacter arcticus TaxID=1655435 RepID=A0A2U1ZXD2_9MICO|nr:hypothetical protein [Serinibacter arcticus]PWD51582.1 hypothetical protein C8046_13955 [Serinibacter arcticus]
MTTGVQPPTRRRPALVRVASRSVWVWGIVAGTIALALGTWAGGGFREVPEDGLPVIPADALVSLGPFDVAIEGWTVSSSILTSDLEYADAAAWLVIAADFRANPPRSTVFYEDMMTVSALEPVGFAKTVHPTDGTYLTYLHPGVTTPALVLIPLGSSDAATIDDLSVLPVVLGSRVWVAHSLTDEMGWFRTTPRASVQVPRDDSVAELAELAEDAA